MSVLPRLSLSSVMSPRSSFFPQLHQLLTEQLQDDLLDDSVSTVTTEGGMADSTLLGDEVGVSLDRVISPNQSCDLAPSLHDTDEGRDEGLSTGNVCLTSHDPDAVQHHMDPSQVAPSGDMVAPSGDMVAPSGDMHPLPSPPAPVVRLLVYTRAISYIVLSTCVLCRWVWVVDRQKCQMFSVARHRHTPSCRLHSGLTTPPP